MADLEALTITLNTPFFISPANTRLLFDGPVKTGVNLLTVFCPENDHLHALEVDRNRRLRCHSVREPISGKLSSVVNDEVRLAKASQFIGSRPYEHIMHKQYMICSSTNDAHFDAILGVPLARCNYKRGYHDEQASILTPANPSNT